jgi:hypothetical protein
MIDRLYRPTYYTADWEKKERFCYSGTKLALPLLMLSAQVGP